MPLSNINNDINSNNRVKDKRFRFNSISIQDPWDCESDNDESHESPKMNSNYFEKVFKSDSVLIDISHLIENPLHRVVNNSNHSNHIFSLSPLPSPNKFGINEVDSSLSNRETRLQRRLIKFHQILLGNSLGDINLNELRKLSWSGIPSNLRHAVWPILLGYLPTSKSRRCNTLSKKRLEYTNACQLAFERPLESKLWHQIVIDVPRTNPGNRLWQFEVTQRSLEKILYVWSIRHPASGYVQGINDLATPFFQVYLSAYINCDPERFDPAYLPKEAILAIEADTFWSLSKLLDGIQDNYIIAQPGIQRQVKKLKELTSKIDPCLYKHFEEQGVEFIQFSFRWINCLLMREMKIKNVIRMWDTYLSEGHDSFSNFHLYVCLAFLIKWSQTLQTMDFQNIIMFLQSLPTSNWDDHEIELLLSEAYVLKSVWQHAQSHLP